jgi:hypothetical protein
VGSEEVEIVSAAGEGFTALPEPDPPQALRSPRADNRIMAKNEFRIGRRRRACRVIGFMGLDIPILVRAISREYSYT